MRKVEVYAGNRHAGQLTEKAPGHYEFVYNEQYLIDTELPAIALSLPKQSKPFHSKKIFPFFTSLLPEGSNRKAMCLAHKVDDQDFFGMLEMICGMDCIGNVTLRKEQK